ncbi:MAG: UTP--glucose-1-phosphate uridylyltransferase [Phycisphaerales bacterium]|nr:UTP--glucose-1-phosphate uridylyltransferase [Phycisphaerales bacterium]
MTMRETEWRRKAKDVGQEHLFAFWDELTLDQRDMLLAQLASIDLESVPTLVEKYVRNKPDFSPGGASIEPVNDYPNDHTNPRRAWDRAHYHALGEEMLRRGEVAAFTVAGGQGTRLGYDGPKGCYPGSAVRGRPLFECLSRWLVGAEKRYGHAVPWYIMTSPLNDEATRAFFGEHKNFGLDPANISFFQQGVVPSFDAASGRILLSDRHVIATNPDGHGGSLKALRASGALADMRGRGVRHISYFQIDNPLARAVDPVFLGLHAHAPDSSAQMSSKMVAKTEPGEKVGVFATIGGKVGVIEYSDLPGELASRRRADGSLVFNAGNVAIHALGVEFVEGLSRAGAGLPYHRAEKKVPHIDLETGRRIEPSAANGIKLETFVFDAISMCEASLVYETDRVDEFAPIKNASGSDSPESSALLQTERAARWLEAVGVRVPRKADGSPDCVLEIDPARAMRAQDLRSGPLPMAIEQGARVVID